MLFLSELFRFPISAIHNASIRTKLVLPLLGFTLTLWGVLAYSLWQQDDLLHQSELMSNVQLPALAAVMRARIDLQKALASEQASLQAQASSEQFKTTSQHHHEHIRHAEHQLKRFAALYPEGAKSQAWQEMMHEMSTWTKTSEALVHEHAHGNHDGVQASQPAEHSDAQSHHQYALLYGHLGRFNDVLLKRISAHSVAARESLESSRLILISMAIVSTFFSLGMLFLMPLLIGNRLKRVQQCIAEIAHGDGDLTRRIDESYRDEIGLIGRGLNQFLDSLHNSMLSVRYAAVDVGNSAEEIADGNMSLANRTETQALNVSQAASKLEHVSVAVAKTADNAAQVNFVAREAHNMAASGGAVLDRAVRSMDNIEVASRKISTIVGVVDSIAFQTKILALNAAIEAARAGSQGRGFAVVAAEVQGLAQRSAGAAKEIHILVEDTVGKVKQGSELVHKSGENLSRIVDSIRDLSETIEQITQRSHRQNTDVAEVNDAVSKIGSMMQESAALVEEVAAGARLLDTQSNTLGLTIAHFKLHA